jgi:Stealth protein CR2, conserved region 2
MNTYVLCMCSYLLGRSMDEIRFSLRSLSMFLPWWKGDLYFVTPGHYPSWLNVSDPRIHLVHQVRSVCVRYIYRRHDALWREEKREERRERREKGRNRKQKGSEGKNKRERALSCAFLTAIQPFVGFSFPARVQEESANIQLYPYRAVSISMYSETSQVWCAVT